MNEIDIIDQNEPKRISEFYLKNPTKPVGIWKLPNVQGFWSIGVEFIDSLEAYPDATVTIQDFIRSKKNILQGLKLNMMVSSSGQKREMIFLQEDAMFDIFLLQYSQKPIAKEYQQGAREKFIELRKTGIAIREDMKEQLKTNSYEYRKYMLNLLLEFNEEQKQLQGQVHEIEVQIIDVNTQLSENLREKYISIDNKDFLINMVHQIHLNSNIPHDIIYYRIYEKFRVFKPKSNLKRINFILNEDIPAIKQYLEQKYKLLTFFTEN